MRILQINHSHFIRGGADVVYFNTASLLKEKGHEVAFFSTIHENNKKIGLNEYFVHSINYHDAPFFPKIVNTPKYLYNKEAFQKIILIIKKFKPDIAHVHLFYGTLSVSILHALKKMSIPVVHTVHDYRLLCPVYSFLDNNHQICEACKNHQFWNCFVKRCSDGNIYQSAVVAAEAYFWHYGYQPLHLIDHVIFVSKFIQSKHIEYNQAYADKSSHLYNFHDTNTDLVNFPRGKGNYLLFFGRLSKEKGINTLLETIAGKEVNLVIAGKGPLEDLVKNYAQNFKNIRYVGFQQGKSLKNLIQKASYIMVPSEWYENNPMTIVEAFSLGKPVIGARIGGIPELIQENYNGFLFHYGNKESLLDALNKAVNLSEKEYQIFSDNALKFAKLNFNKETHYDSLIKIYKKTINHHHSAGKNELNNEMKHSINNDKSIKINKVNKKDRSI